MKRFVVVGAWIAAFTLLGSGAAAAQQGGGGGGGSKVAYVNTQAILKATPGYAAAESTFTVHSSTHSQSLAGRLALSFGSAPRFISAISWSSCFGNAASLAR